MEIKTSAFTLSAPRESMCPKDNKPEYAFIGRSNVGKSSLINMLCNHKGLAKTSATPGKPCSSTTSSSITNGISWTCLAMVLPNGARKCNRN